jgi:hypothetical protein
VTDTAAGSATASDIGSAAATDSVAATGSAAAAGSAAGSVAATGSTAATGSVAAAKKSVAPPRLPAAKPTATGLAPVDPYAPDLANEVELTSMRAAGELQHCHQDARVTGDVRIDFVVQPDGRVTHAHPSKNTTGSAQLATCLAQVISKWTFAVHPAEPTHFTRPFSYAAGGP